ncbi:MAG: GntR family transcriptional regulator [Verrucomicrobiaceae bacterium]|nr:MAG: GntR family transcriptional regulator [Verrucomicrobiaceae bacterium]
MPDDPPRLFLPPISPAAPGALYDQIIAGLKREISEGRLAPGSALPSFRQLAADLMVSLITVKRAYQELENEGLIYRRQGLGTFVSGDGGERGRELKLAHARRLIHEAAREAREGGIPEAALPRFFTDTLTQRPLPSSTSSSSFNQPPQP